MPAASRRSAIEPFRVMEVMRAAAAREAAGERVLHLEVGQPSTSAPGGVLDAARRALVEDRLGYAPALGLPALRSRIAQWYGERYGVDIEATRVVVSDEVVVINSFSKYFSMTGWRLGWIVAPEVVLGPLERLGQNLAISAPTLSQLAAVAAFDCVEELEENVARYRRNRSLLLDRLPALGLTATAPADGAFYVYADSRSFGLPSSELCRRWLDEAAVAVTPGVDFDPHRGSGWVRFSYAGSPEEICEAMDRLATWAGRR